MSGKAGNTLRRGRGPSEQSRISAVRAGVSVLVVMRCVCHGVSNYPDHAIDPARLHTVDDSKQLVLPHCGTAANDLDRNLDGHAMINVGKVRAQWAVYFGERGCSRDTPIG